MKSLCFKFTSGCRLHAGKHKLTPLNILISLHVHIKGRRTGGVQNPQGVTETVSSTEEISRGVLWLNIPEQTDLLNRVFWIW